MESAKPRRLIVNADDFGRSAAINQAVTNAHQSGVLTSASLMVNGAAFDDAVALARSNPLLGVGLHLTLVAGIATLPPCDIPNLVNNAGEFSNNAVASGIKYYFSATTQEEIEREMRAQIEKFLATGLRMDHLNGHLHLHLHPAIWKILKASLARYNIRHVRLTHEPAYVNLRHERHRWGYRISHAIVFKCLSSHVKEDFRKLQLFHPDQVYGLLQNGCVDESYLLRLLPLLPAGLTEIYSHPSLDQFKDEYTALISSRVREMIQREKIELIRYQDL